jgi:hypothetical protein
MKDTREQEALLEQHLRRTLKLIRVYKEKSAQKDAAIALLSICLAVSAPIAGFYLLQLVFPRYFSFSGR